MVVIAIIGILSAIVLAALGGARSGAKEASILSSLNSARTQAEIYHISNNSYSGLCGDEKIQEIVASLTDTGDGAECWVSTDTYSDYRTELAMFDYGIGVKLDDIYYVASPLGSGTVDSSNTVVGGDSTISWDAAKTACSDAGNRLPSPSALRAMHNIESDTPEGFSAGYHWSALESPADSSEAYHTILFNGSVNRNGKSNGSFVRCVH